MVLQPYNYRVASGPGGPLKWIFFTAYLSLPVRSSLRKFKTNNVNGLMANVADPDPQGSV